MEYARSRSALFADGIGDNFLEVRQIPSSVEQKLGEHPIEEFHVIIRLIDEAEIWQMQSVGGVLIFAIRTSF